VRGDVGFYANEDLDLYRKGDKMKNKIWLGVFVITVVLFFLAGGAGGHQKTASKDKT